MRLQALLRGRGRRRKQAGFRALRSGLSMHSAAKLGVIIDWVRHLVNGFVTPAAHDCGFQVVSTL